MHVQSVSRHIYRQSYTSVQLFLPCFKCPMKSCETKVTLSKVEHHLTTSHPDVYILFKRILMEKYGISKKKCDLCGFCFQTEADYESHLGTFYKLLLFIGPQTVHHSHWSTDLIGQWWAH